MADVQDVAAYIVGRMGSISTMKLQKLVYYSQAWSLVWDECPLFDDEIQAWINGPVVYALYQHHRGRFTVNEWAGDPARLTEEQRETIDGVIAAYGKYSGQQLSEMTHREQPWRDAREGLSDTDRGTSSVSVQTMQDYYLAVSTSEESVAL